MKEVIIDNNGNTITLHKLFQEYNNLIIQSNLLVISINGDEYRIVDFYTDTRTHFRALLNLETKLISCCNPDFNSLEAYVKNLIEKNYKVFLDSEV